MFEKETQTIKLIKKKKDKLQFLVCIPPGLEGRKLMCFFLANCVRGLGSEGGTYHYFFSRWWIWQTMFGDSGLKGRRCGFFPVGDESSWIVRWQDCHDTRVSSQSTRPFSLPIATRLRHPRAHQHLRVDIHGASGSRRRRRISLRISRRNRNEGKSDAYEMLALVTTLELIFELYDATPMK